MNKTHVIKALALGVAAMSIASMAFAQTTPTITSISPSFLNQGSSSTMLTVNGTNFTSNSVVKFNGIQKSTTFISANQVKATIDPIDTVSSGNFPVMVSNSDGSAASNSVLLTVSKVGLPNTGIGPDDSGTSMKFNLIMGIVLAVLLIGTAIGSREILTYNR